MFKTASQISDEILIKLALAAWKQNLAPNSPQYQAMQSYTKDIKGQGPQQWDPLSQGTKSYESGVAARTPAGGTRAQGVAQMPGPGTAAQYSPRTMKKMTSAGMAPKPGHLPQGPAAGGGLAGMWKGLGRFGRAGVVGGAAALGGYGLYKAFGGGQQQQPQQQYGR